MRKLRTNVIRHVMSDQVGQASPATVLLKPATFGVKQVLMDGQVVPLTDDGKMDKIREIRVDMGKRSRDILERAVAGWENFTDEEGKPMPYAPSEIGRFISLLEDSDVDELVKTVTKEVEKATEAQKN